MLVSLPKSDAKKIIANELRDLLSAQEEDRVAASKVADEEELEFSWMDDMSWEEWDEPEEEPAYYMEDYSVHEYLDDIDYFGWGSEI